MPASRVSGVLRRAVHPLYRRLETRVHPLRYLFLEITQRCNLRCRHCGSDCGRETRADELSTDEWLAFLQYLPRHFEPTSLALVVTGGEPFCHPEFDRIRAGLRGSGLSWGMVTNGWALTPRNLQRVLEAGLRSLTVSLDGLRESHDWLRGVPGSFERARAGIRALVASGLPTFDVVTCANPRNLAELPALAERLRADGVPAWRLFSIFPKGRAKGDPELLLPPAGFRELLAFIRAERERGGPMRVDFSCEGFLPGGLDRAVRDEPYFCRAGIAIGSVLCDGAISACPNITRELVQGNLRTDDFAEVWEHRFGKYRDRSWMRTEGCAGCGDWSRCLGNSLHLWDPEARAAARCTRDDALGRDAVRSGRGCADPAAAPRTRVRTPGDR